METPKFEVSEATANLLQAYAENTRKVTHTIQFIESLWETNKDEADGAGTMQKAVENIKHTGEAYLEAIKAAVWENIEFELYPYELSADRVNTI